MQLSAIGKVLAEQKLNTQSAPPPSLAQVMLQLQSQTSAPAPTTTNPLGSVFLTPLYIRDKKQQSFHDWMVQYVADLHKQMGWYVEASHIKGYLVRPEKIGDSIPDVVARLNGREKIIFEVETEDSCTSAHAFKQLRNFTKSGNKVVVVVPQFLDRENHHLNELCSKIVKHKIDVMIRTIVV